jgi:P4 family phage/plasmid primase-like protien
MQDASPPEPTSSEAGAEAALQLLATIFAEDDLVLFRPIETWTDQSGRKQSSVHYKQTCYRRPAQVRHTIDELLKVCAEERTNLFFGVCPRFGDQGRFDLAWQIRTVRALWCDIDNVTVQEALARVAKVGLPEPSVVVNSGNGVHLYWLLEEPFAIDDAGDPPPVFVEWVDGKNGKRRPRKYIEDADSKERLYLDVRANVPDRSPKALLVQDVLSSIAAAIGGDHTQDLSRLLRVPGSLNRKDERNGRTPVLCELVKCDASNRYSFVHFSKLAENSPSRAHRKQIRSLPLPSCKPLSPTKRDKLNDLVTKCAAAPVGGRSEADWNLVCTAIEKGWPKAEVWQAVAAVGKFSERGEEYFELTWSKAAEHTREQLFRKAAAEQRGNGLSGSPPEGEDGGEDEGGDLGLVVTVARLIGETERFAQDEGGKLYRYSGGVYRTRGEAFVRSRVKALCQELNRPAEWSSHVANEVVEFIRVDSPLLWERPPADVINVKNGLLNVATRELDDHSPDHLSPVQLPVAYDPTAACPKIDKFIGEVFPEDATTLAYEIPAWLMTPDTSIQKAVLLIGSGGNGKSRYLRMVEAFLGTNNVSNLSLHRLESDRFACARLYGKLANICPDLPTEHLAGTSVFKAITGGDPVTGEYKFKDSFDFVAFCRLVFSANSPPRAHDASEGFFDRWLVVPFERRFRGEGGEIRSEQLDAMLSEPEEQSGLLNRTLDVLGGLRSVGRFTESDSLIRAFSEFHATTDPLSVWLDSHTVEGPGLVTPKRNLITAFGSYCEQHGRAPLSEKAFGTAFKKLRPDVEDKQRTVHGKVQWCYVGIGIKHEVPRRSGDLDPEDDSLGSRDSRDIPSLNLSRGNKKTPQLKSDSIAEKDRADRVNRVNAVNGSCRHDERVDEIVGDRIRTTCNGCGKFIGYRPAKNGNVKNGLL